MDFQTIMQNPVIGFIGTFVGVIGLISSIIFYFKSRRFQRPTFSKRSIKWFDGKSIPHEDIKLTFRGKEISRFVITHLAFWNSGNQTIRKSDFAKSSVLRIAIPSGTEVFDVRVTACTAPEIQVSLNSPNSFEADAFKEIEVDFEYLDANDGFSIQIIHDGQSDKFQFLGKLPGVADFLATKSSYSDVNRRFVKTLERGVNIVGPLQKWVIVPLLCLGFGSYGLWNIYQAIFHEFHWYQPFFGILAFYLVIPFLIFSDKSPPKALLLSLANE